MDRRQVEAEIRKEFMMNGRLANLVKEHAKNYADELYRRTKNITDHAELIKRTAEAAAIERFVQLMIADDKSTDRHQG